MPPRNAASTPDLSEARKSNLPSLGESAVASTSTESLTSLTRNVQVKMTSVRQRAKDLEQLAASRRQTAFSPRTSSSLVSPSSKSDALGKRFTAPQNTINRSTITGDEFHNENVGSFSLDDSPRRSATTISARNDQSTGSVSIQKDVNTDGGYEGSQTVAAESSEDDEDETPRQSANYSGNIVKITRQDSSRQANYSLKPRKYSPDLQGLDQASVPAAPRLPELYFQDTIPEDTEVDSVTQPSRLVVDLHKVQEDEGVVDAESLAHRAETGLKSDPETPPADDLDANNHTFYWPSPNDSTDETDEGSDKEEHCRIASVPINSHSTLTSATALGFGGPSDWEHFYAGDYETTELIDDTDLYLTKKEKNEQNSELMERRGTDAVKLADGDKDDNKETDDLINDPQTGNSPAMPHIQEALKGDEADTNDAGFHTAKFKVKDNSDTDSSSRLVDMSDTSRSFDVAAAAAVTATAAMRSQASKETVRLVNDGHNDNGDDDDGDGDGDGDDDDHDGEAVAARHGVPRESDEEAGSGTEIGLSNGQGSGRTSKTPPPSSIAMPSDELSSSSNLFSGPSSPSPDDPNASEITISMVLPPDFDPQGSELKQRDVQDVAQSVYVADLRKSVFPQAEEYNAPYDGLSPTSKASLNRFIRMLREEQGMTSDYDKYHVFVNFVKRESKLRATLYDMDEESELSKTSSARQSLASTSNFHKRRPSRRQKPLPVPPDELISTDVTIGRTQSMLASGVSRQLDHHQDTATEGALHTSVARPGSSRQSEGNHIQGTSTTDVRSESLRPSVATTPADSNQALTHQTSLETLNRSIDLIAPRSSMMMDASSVSSSRPSLDKPADQRQSTASSPLPGAQILEQSLAGKANESKPYDGNKVTNRQSIYRPFSGMLRSSSSNRRTSAGSNATVRSSERPADGKNKKLDDEPEAFSRISKSERSVSAIKPRTSALESLMAIIPRTNTLREEPRQLSSLRFDMDNIRDDFSFIHKTVLAWDSEAKQKREFYEVERQKRISENERRVDELFNENEIGYGDISHLEDEFKNSESARKAKEEREEVESFVASVFDVVWARINYEMDHLTPLYQEATRMVAEASAGKQMFEDIDNSVPIAPIMEILLILYQKLMIRHQKAFEAVLERDRRLKKTEISPWFNLGEFERVKRIEKRFEDAEKKAILEFCRERDERANQLMDVLDSHTLRGVGANQDYMESIMQAVRRLSIQFAAKSDGGKREKPRPSRDNVVKAKLVTAALSRSSEQIVRTFHVADMLLNAADYEVSVASAKWSNAEGDAFKRLREAKAKEDLKLAADLEHRLGLIRSDTSRTQEEVAKLVLLLGEADPELKFDIGKERDKRMVAALEDALRRDLPPPPPAK